MAKRRICFLFLCVFDFSMCGYQPTGEEVQPGSVLLPATRRGRYLANIVRRQAVDGTGIKFNKDADRMNAEAKKKVDVLSEELLPYIIAEQERRTTLYKRIMTAIQNGEKGITIAEIRNKPPLMIRKGMLYRCPANRAPKEPDGSGMLMCEEEVEPTQIMYDSCLSAEDKELYVAENKYFFCNRHKIEGPDLPRNGTTVIGCAPIERTSLNYTTSKCALEDTDDVVVHYRYYPDRTYKFVTELDPDREVCDHWNPCQIGYIYSLPSPDQALLANELWHNYAERNDEYERDEIVPPIPVDSHIEYVSQSAKNYTSSTRRVVIPEGYTFDSIQFHHIESHEKTIKGTDWTPLNADFFTTKISPNGRFLKVTYHFPTWAKKHYGAYRVKATKKDGSNTTWIDELYLYPSSARMAARTLEILHGQRPNSTEIPYRCDYCRLLGIMVRPSDGNIYNLDTSKYRIREYTDRQGRRQQLIEIDVEGNTHLDFGDYFAILQNKDGGEERLRVLSVISPDTAIKTTRLTISNEVGKHFEQNLNYDCDDCVIMDVLCNGESLLTSGRVSIIPVAKTINFNFPRFEDNLSCVYMGYFNKSGTLFSKIIAVIDNNSPGVTIRNVDIKDAPKEGEPFEHEIQYSCETCTVEKAYVNGIPLETSYRRSSVGPIAFYVVTSSSILIRITEYMPIFEGVYQAVFTNDGETITKTILEIRDKSNEAAPDNSKTTPDGSPSSAAPILSTGTDDGTLMSTTVAEETASSAPPESKV